MLNNALCQHLVRNVHIIFDTNYNKAENYSTLRNKRASYADSLGEKNSFLLTLPYFIVYNRYLYKPFEKKGFSFINSRGQKYLPTNYAACVEWFFETEFVGYDLRKPSEIYPTNLLWQSENNCRLYKYTMRSWQDSSGDLGVMLK